MGLYQLNSAPLDIGMSIPTIIPRNKISLKVPWLLAVVLIWNSILMIESHQQSIWCINIKDVAWTPIRSGAVIHNFIRITAQSQTKLRWTRTITIKSEESKSQKVVILVPIRRRLYSYLASNLLMEYPPWNSTIYKNHLAFLAIQVLHIQSKLICNWSTTGWMKSFKCRN